MYLGDYSDSYVCGKVRGVFFTGLLFAFGVFVFSSCAQQGGADLKTNDTSGARDSASDSTGDSAAAKGAVTPPKREAEVTVAELKAALDNKEDIYVLDVRTQAEFDAGHVPEVDTLIPHTDILSGAASLPFDTSKYVYCFCRSGNRSGHVTKWLRDKGYSHVYNVIGGMLAWSDSDYPVAR